MSKDAGMATRKRLAIGAAVGVFIIGVLVFWILATPYFYYYPVIPWAVFTVDGKPAEGLTAFRHRSGRTVIVIRPAYTGRETYFVNIADPNSTNDDFQRSFVASCDESSIFVHRLLAVQNHQQMCRPFIVNDGEQSSQKTTKVERNLIVTAKAVEFSADDGKRIGVRW
jgi:hypothetical protein